MSEMKNCQVSSYHETCPCAVVLDIASSIASAESALACILSAECAKINKIVSTSGDLETLISIDTSAQATIARITELETVLKAKLDDIMPLLTDCM
jgi:hypothetical protein